ncbi:hypothetical protein VQL36_18630 [Chengkuizengella sp. SCS-71B]|uniref:hypothetical protein n=1 Tax=Chengkuizengella sp. SCS-71B TaxID=3115290 RepID=UPI0032C227CF
MRILLTFTLVLCLFLSGCSDKSLIVEELNPRDNIHGNAEISWTDFVNINDKKYFGAWEVIISDSSFVNENDVVGEVEFKLAGVVGNPSYKSIDGDAAFLDIGTKLYSVKGFENQSLIVVIDKNRINGYQIYQEENQDLLPNRFSEIVKQDIEKIELYHSRGLGTKIQTLAGEDVKKFISLLEEGLDTPNYQSNITDRDPIYYDMVFYTGGTFAYTLTLANDGENYFFHPWETRVVSKEIEQYFQ